LNKNDPVELTPLELCTLRNEFVLLRSLFGIVGESFVLMNSDIIDNINSPHLVSRLSSSSTNTITPSNGIKRRRKKQYILCFYF
ncbi:unnamed protein product, partial [Adineta steineri]